jgi:hypothetical protein
VARAPSGEIRDVKHKANLRLAEPPRQDPGARELGGVAGAK